jgi:ubiquinol-cytochrome c reductase cytochrome c1 subunit
MKYLLTLSVAVLMAAAPALAKDANAPASIGTQEGAAVQAPAEKASADKGGAGESNPAAQGAPIVAEAPKANEEAHGVHEAPEVPQMDWSFNGPFGTFDRAALQRGFQVYKQVCAACHSLNRLAYRNLAALGYDEAEIKSIAAEATISDGPNDEGEMFDRPGRPSDRFKAPFANDQAARYANGGALPPDLSLIVRARHDGSNYVHGILTGFTDPPAGFTVNPGMHYNKYFPGNQIAMPPPLAEGALTYDDGTTASVDQMAKDVATFLTWASDPTMEIRKQTGLKVLVFLLVFTGLMYLTKRRVWKDLH